MTIRKYVIFPQVFISVHRRSCDVAWITESSVFSHKEAFLCFSAFHSFARPVSIALSLSFSQIRLCSSHAIGHRAVNRSGTLIRVTFIQAHAPVASHTISFFSSLFLKLVSVLNPHSQKTGKNVMGTAPCAEDGPLGMPLAHREPDT